MPNSLTYFPVTGDFYNVTDPALSGSTTVPQVQIIEGLVTFRPRLPPGFLAYVDDYIVELAASERQLVTLLGAVGGTFTLSYQGQVTTGIAYNAAATAVQSALVALSTIGAGNVAVTGNAGGPYTVTFQGAMSNSFVDKLVVDYSALTGVAPTITVATQTPGAPALNAAQTLTITGTGGTFKLSYGGYTTGSLLYNAAPSVVQSALLALRSITGSDVTVLGTAAVEHTIEFVSNLAGEAVPLINTISALTGGGITVTLDQQGIPVTNEVQTITLANTYGGTFTLTFGGQTTTDIRRSATSIEVQRALEALSTIGTGNVSVTGPINAVYTVEFVRSLGGTNVAQMTANGTNLVGGTALATVIQLTKGTPQISRDTAIAMPPRKARIWNGQLSTIDVVDAPGFELVANSTVIGLATRGFSSLIYDVEFTEVSYAGGSQKIENFAFTAPTDTTAVCITDPALTRLEYARPV